MFTNRSCQNLKLMCARARRKKDNKVKNIFYSILVSLFKGGENPIQFSFLSFLQSVELL